MIKLTNEQIYDILATTSHADLRNVDLSYMELSGVDFKEADLSGSILHGTNLCEASLQNVNLRGADMSFVNAAYAFFARADLRGADFRAANLSHAVFEKADLRNAKFNSLTVIREAWFDNARLDGVEGLNSTCLLACPETGSFVGWKKARMLDKNPAPGKHYAIYSVIVKLRILEDAKRSSATSRKCRCSAAMVEEIQTLDGKRITPDSSMTIFSFHDPNFIYETGKIVSVPDFDPNRWDECSTGIHFFITREEAVNY